MEVMMSKEKHKKTNALRILDTHKILYSISEYEWSEERAAGLHVVEALKLDEKQVFIGSFNFDPRSAYLNTEIGVLLNSPPLAKAVHGAVDQNLSRFAYKLVLDANNKITWQHQTPQGTLIYKQEPQMKWWQKASLKVVSWLPIQGFM